MVTGIAIVCAAVVVDRVWRRSIAAPNDSTGDLEELVGSAGRLVLWLVVVMALVAVVVLAVTG